MRPRFGSFPDCGHFVVLSVRIGGDVTPETTRPCTECHFYQRVVYRGKAHHACLGQYPIPLTEDDLSRGVCRDFRDRVTGMNGGDRGASV